MKQKKCETILEKYYEEEGSIISILQDVQEEFGYIPEDAVFWFSERLNIPASNFYGIATFYAQFYLKPRGKNIIHICLGTACYVKKAEDILRIIKDDFKLEVGGITDDKKFSLEAVRCLGTCGLAPVMVVGHDIYGAVEPKRVKKILDRYNEHR